MERMRGTLVGGDVAVILALIGVVVALRRRLTRARAEAQIARDEFLVVDQRLAECRAELRSARALE